MKHIFLGTLLTCGAMLTAAAAGPKAPLSSRAVPQTLAAPQDAEESGWQSLGYGVYHNAFFFDNDYAVEVEQSLDDSSRYRLVAPYTQGFAEEGFEVENPVPYVYFQVVAPGQTIPNTSVTVPENGDEYYLYISAYNTGWNNPNYNADVLAMYGANLSNPTLSDFAGQRVLEMDRSGRPELISMGSYYYMSMGENSGGWDYLTNTTDFTFTFPGSGILSVATPLNNTDISIKYSVTMDSRIVDHVNVGLVRSDEVQILSPEQVEAAAAALREGNAVMTAFRSSSGEGSFMPMTTGRYTIVAIAYDSEGNELRTDAALAIYDAAGAWNLDTPLSLNADLYQYQRIAGAHNDFGYPSLMLWLDTRSGDMTGVNTGYNWYNSPAALSDVASANTYGSHYAWKYPYANISVANTILYRVGSETSTDPNEMFVIAQARAYRAFDYWVLAQLFQHNYKGHESAPCVPLITSDNMLSAKTGGAPRATVQEVYGQILADLDVAIDYLTRCGVNSQSKQLISLATAYGLRARVHLTMHSYAEAAADAAKAIGSFVGCPVPVSEVAYPTFYSMDMDDWMWGIHPDADSRVVTSGIVNWPSHMVTLDGNGYAGTGVWRKISRALFDRIPDSDIRHGWWLDRGSRSENLTPTLQSFCDGWGVSPYANVKFGFGEGAVVGSQDIPMMRIEEMYLIQAEATAMSGDVDRGAAYLRDFMRSFRDPVYELPAITTAEDLQAEVWMQRRVELWGEGLAWFDLMRLGKGIDRRGGDWTSEWCFNVPAGDPLMIFPIPASEIAANPLITEEDNNPLAAAPEAVTDYPYLTARFNGLCADDNVLTITASGYLSATQKLMGRLFTGDRSDIDAMTRLTVRGGSAMVSGSSYTLNVPAGHSGPVTFFCVAVEADGTPVGISRAVAYVHDDNDGEWEPLGLGNIRETIAANHVDGMSTLNGDCEIQKHVSIDGYYRVMNPYGSNPSHSGHGHHLYIHAEDPEYVYIEPFTTGPAVGIALSSRTERFISKGADPSWVRGSLPGLFGKKSDRDITFGSEDGRSAPLSVTYAPRDARHSWHQATGYIAVTLPAATGLTSVAAEASEESMPVEYYNLQGIRVANPVEGQVYVVRRADGSATKIVK